jgi:hypothetical protein
VHCTTKQCGNLEPGKIPRCYLIDVQTTRRCEAHTVPICCGLIDLKIRTTPSKHTTKQATQATIYYSTNTSLPNPFEISDNHKVQASTSSTHKQSRWKQSKQRQLFQLILGPFYTFPHQASKIAASRHHICRTFLSSSHSGEKKSLADIIEEEEEEIRIAHGDAHPKDNAAQKTTSVYKDAAKVLGKQLKLMSKRVLSTRGKFKTRVHHKL